MHGSGVGKSGGGGGGGDGGGDEGRGGGLLGKGGRPTRGGTAGGGGGGGGGGGTSSSVNDINIKPQMILSGTCRRYGHYYPKMLLFLKYIFCLVN